MLSPWGCYIGNTPGWKAQNKVAKYRQSNKPAAHPIIASTVKANMNETACRGVKSAFARSSCSGGERDSSALGVGELIAASESGIWCLTRDKKPCADTGM